MDNWRGKLALKAQAPADPDQSSSFSASFELQGAASQGELTLYTPIGTTAAQVQWQPGRAWMQTSSQTQIFSNLQALLQSLLGTEVPVGALFAWLHGQALTTAGWEVDLSQRDQGKIVAIRQASPKARLLIQLEP
jgi:outer membrane lipoprotein LolB